MQRGEDVHTVNCIYKIIKISQTTEALVVGVVVAVVNISIGSKYFFYWFLPSKSKCV